jgi:anti-anti-sigma factor
MPVIPSHLGFLAVKVVDDVAVLGLPNSLSLSEPEQIERLGKELLHTIDERKFTKVLLNLHNADFMSSAMLAQLIYVRRKMQSIRGKLRLCALRPPVIDAFTVSQFDKLFEIFPDEPSAFKSF